MMNDMFADSVMIGAVLSVFAFQIGLFCQKKFKQPLVNPMLIAASLIIVILLALDVEYDSYNKSAHYISYLLTPTTVSLAIPLYEKLEILKKNIWAILLGVLSGVLANLTCIYVLSLVFQLTHEEYVTLIPKSITTAIALGLVAEFDGIVTIMIVAITISGLLGNMFAEQTFKWFAIKNPISQGLAIGNSSHAIGTSKLMEIGDVQGAMGGLAIVVAGLMTTILASVYATFI